LIFLIAASSAGSATLRSASASSLIALTSASLIAALASSAATIVLVYSASLLSTSIIFLVFSTSAYVFWSSGCLFSSYSLSLATSIAASYKTLSPLSSLVFASLKNFLLSSKIDLYRFRSSR
jgi:hypothetical protein